MKKRSTVCCALLLWAAILHPLKGGSEGQAGAFLRMGVGARAMAMGGGSTALCGDATTAYYNPAGLVFSEQCVSATWNSMALDRSLLHIGYAQTLGGEDNPLHGGFSLGWLCAGVDDIDARDMNGNQVGTLSSWEHCFFFSFALKPLPFASVGINAKVLYYRLPDIATDGGAVSATGLGFDIGILIRPLASLTVGITLRDLRAAYHWDTQNLWERGAQTNNPLPQVFRLGVGWTGWSNRLRVTADMEQVESMPLSFLSGVEVAVIRGFVLRGGWYHDRPTLGAGFRFEVLGKSVEMDYAFSPDPVAPSPNQFFTWSFFL